MSRIVILDGKTTNPGDLDWRLLEDIGELTVFDKTPSNLIIERAGGAEIVLTNKTSLDAAVLQQLSSLKLVCVMATGYDNVDVAKCRELGITVCNVRGYSTPSVVQHTFSLILELLNKVGEHSDGVKEGDWHRSSDFAYWNQPILELAGKTLGVIGFGNIGRSVAKVGLAFGMNVISYHTHEVTFENVRFLPFEELLKQSDIVSLHCPLKENNYHMISGPQLELMPENALLVNTARGGLVNHNDLIEALKSSVIAGAGIDVLEEEPPGSTIELPDINNLVVTPHQAWASRESRIRLIEGLADNIKCFLTGNPKNVVN